MAEVELVDGKVAVPAHTHVPGTEYTLPEGVAFGDLIPGAFKGKPYLKDIADMPTLLKKLDGAETLIGQRPAGIPDDNADEATWGSFFKAAGRPDTAEGYSFNTTKKADGTDAERNSEVEAKVKGIFHKHGLSAKQATGVQTDYDAVIMELMDAANTKTAEQDAEFDKLAKGTFGTDFDKVLASSKTLIEANMPEGFGDRFKNLSNDNLVLMAGVLNNIKNKYIKEDIVIPGGGGGLPGSELELREEAKKLMASKEWTEYNHPGNKAAKARVTEIYNRIREIETEKLKK